MPRKKCIEIVLDVETTGLDYTKERMVEFAAIRLENGKMKDRFQTLINPEQHIRKSSIAIHGITEDDVKDAPTEAQVMPMILDFISDYPIVAHNAIFDYSFINEASIRQTGNPITNVRIDSQMMFKEVYPELESCGLESLMNKFNVKFSERHRAMADTEGLAKAYPELKKLYEKKYAWQIQQLDNIDYLFERYLRIQQAVQIMQSEMQDLKSIFRLYFEKGGENIHSPNGETLIYQSKQSYAYDFVEIKDVLEEIGVLHKAVKLNNNFIDRLITSNSISKENKEKLAAARQMFSETRNIHIIKSDRKLEHIN
ncbi:MAG: 3'-5' exonuclease [Candidatus Gastranaerophilales bacterium]|nr:3'-5' exonuclease [Candidatus Gastranaerophilales bacterium]